MAFRKDFQEIQVQVEHQAKLELQAIRGLLSKNLLSILLQKMRVMISNL